MSEPDLLTIYIVAKSALVGTVLTVLWGVIVYFREWWTDFNHPRLIRSVFAVVFSGIPVSIIGFLVGYITATSRSGAVGNLLPALMALLAGLHIYVFGKELQNRMIVSFLATLLTVMIFYGIQYGAYRRDAGREARMEDAIRVEYRIRKIRENLGLPSDMPSWGIGVEAK